MWRLIITPRHICFAGEFYYAVAVVHKNNEAWTFSNLKGRKSCHTGVRKTSGWNVPIGYMINAGIMDVEDCQGDIVAAGSFFNESCAPGTNKYSAADRDIRREDQKT